MAAFVIQMYFTYILQSISTQRYYIGSTDNLDRRLAQHNDPDYKGSKTTKRFKGPWHLVYHETFHTRSQAMIRNIDFADFRAYPPEQYFGLIVLRLRKQDKARVLFITSRIIKLIDEEPLAGNFCL
ncbi:MAG: GIY-YIG nuclease family protein [Desulfobacterales bacterium]